MEQWTRFDFDANWAEFWKHWNMDVVQDALEQQMKVWLEDPAFEDYPPWRRGDALWEYSKTDYWVEKHVNLAFEHIEEHGLVQKYARTKRNLGFCLTDEQAFEGFLETCFGEIEEQFHPKPGSLESLIMISGKNFIMPVLYEVAELIFGNCIMVEDYDENWVVLVPDQKIVFDLYNWYFETREGDDMWMDDECYDIFLDMALNSDTDIEEAPTFELESVCRTDGSGLWSQHTAAVRVMHMVVRVLEQWAYIDVFFDRDTWDTRQHGLIYTDKLWLRDLHELLSTKYGVPPSVLETITYTEQGMQGRRHVSLEGSAEIMEYL